ncbi:DoxX family protein [Marininema halotolerans]|uniref:Uncharacterized membrane protein YphA, DoxX/SURF4 family n=1 Tax=Marininema halotolerans TaxID=1155944 RepID=A0A1I6S4D1_9BACL|nr:DoxX family protein [Marininema halotolerans]SFS71792.1 Uncharacterized membrane protein YphA, DoxX/SURF4 family [Marininema halotolerans]
MVSKGWKVVGWIGLILVALLFLQSGVMKLLGVETAVKGFHKLGYPDWFRLVIGALEVIGGAALLFRKVARYGVALLSVIMVGAIVSILMKGDAIQAIMPGATLIALLVIGNYRKPLNQAGLDHPSEKQVM